MLLDQYPMIVPGANAIKEYVRFYKMYGSAVRYAIVIQEILQSNKENLGYIFQDMIEEMQNRDERLPVYLACIGVSFDRGERGNYKRSLYATDNSEIEKFYKGDLSAYIEQQVNFRFFLNLYTAFESTIADFLCGEEERYTGRQAELLRHLPNRVAGLCQRFNVLTGMQSDTMTLEIIWKYYSLVRNLYLHTEGYVNKKFKDNLAKIKNDLHSIITNNDPLFLECAICDHPNNGFDLFQIEQCKEKSPFILSDTNLTFFRSFIVGIWEAIYLELQQSKAK